MKGVVAVLIALLFMSTGCEERVKPSVVPVGQGELPSQESWASTVLISDSAHVRAVLWSGHISSFSAQRFTMLADSVHVDFYNDREEHTSLLTARRGKVNDATQDFEAHENVVVISDSGTILHTDRLFWTNAEQKIHTDAYVDIVSPTEHIMGTGLISDQALKNYRIFKVTGQSLSHE
jgi:LPS export ABC transporter protein LptC